MNIEEQIVLTKLSNTRGYVITAIDPRYGFVDKVDITYVKMFNVPGRTKKQAVQTAKNRLNTRYAYAADPNFVPENETDEQKDERYETKAHILVLAKRGTGNTMLSKKRRNKLSLP